ncbi:hypothetical protein G6F57_010929 [Rhizopus arrhizus]|uniref:Peptidase S1 domain-containing protein n=1 Tax=Rhizopus oryzae TaxID=64495 RepID=A0A9P7BT74_RHIOR|nr:hypothetical protein G6F23_007476 [Rhizopus arrhizus]KAG1411520.1 hypothetical protein G6F58_008512 [Rhizopus delemar]KAG0792581.1 hypothetical protein G6F21_004248 [Rhizopus arrhizus]KAG0793227.1 hypothetical protein G6F22_005656 [Rhizopus arrhizus]KAG0813740.1 hypothetical protein G6F20_005333 [Rhizopus arrhizus]
MIGNPHLCGGTLLSYNPAFVLTAAHCVADTASPQHSKNRYFVSYRDTQHSYQKMASIADWTIHPLYNVSSIINSSYDVAIIELENSLIPSRQVHRVPLWSSDMDRSLIKQGELIGFGFTGDEQAKTMQKLDLDIIRFENTFNIEARSETEDRVACHGDSGSPLVVHQTVADPSKNKKVQVSFVVGNLVRIYGAQDTQTLTCPIPLDLNAHSTNSTLNTVTEIFVNIASVLDWISQVTGISSQDLTNPFYTPPFDPSKNDSEEEDAINEMAKKWHIGGVAYENGLLNNDTRLISKFVKAFHIVF